MSARPDIRPEELQAFIDGELDAMRAAEIADAERHDNALAGQIAAFRADKTRIADVYAPLVDRPLPAGWLSRIADSSRPRRSAWLAPIAAIAASLVILIGGLATYRQLPASGEESIVREALAARADILEARETLAVASAIQTKDVDRVIAAALKMHVRAPDLMRMGYRLTDVRVYENVPGGKSIELRYRDVKGRDFALYVRHPSNAVRFDQYRRGGLRVCVWQDEVLGAVMTGPVSAAEMQRLASLAYTGLES